MNHGEEASSNIAELEPTRRELRFPALEVRQGASRLLYAFAIDGKELSRFATVSRIKRTEIPGVLGYQRPEVRTHIAEIRRYLESDSPMIPNAVVIAFDGRVRFEPLVPSDEQNNNEGTVDSAEDPSSSYSSHGYLVMPNFEGDGDEEKPGWIVDGQQRLAAIREANIDSFPICAIGFIAPNQREQREQFMLVNSTKPLQKSLIYELLPETTALLPMALEKRRLPTALCERLNLDEDSPMRHLIQTNTNMGGVIKDNSVLKMLENSLNDGVLYQYRNIFDDKSSDKEAMLTILKSFWGAVKVVFREGWGEPPRRSRLMHGAGIIGLGFLMDAIGDRYRIKGLPTMDEFRVDLEAIKPYCCWTSGHWEFGPGVIRKWNELQNTPKDIQLLSNYLLVQYKQNVWSSIRKE